MPTVTESVELPADIDATRTLVAVQLYQADKTPLKEARDSVSGDTIAGRRVVVLDGATPESPSVGAWSLGLTGNADIVPAGTVWGRRLTGPQIDGTLSYATVATSGGPYQWQQILTDPPASIDPTGLAAHAADTDLHSGGQRLGIAHVGNQSTTSTTFVDLPGATLTFTNPTPTTFGLNVDLPVGVATIGQFAELRVQAGATTIGIRNTQNAQATNQIFAFTWHLALPNTLYTPVAGASVTYKVQWRSSGGAVVSVATEFGVPINTGFLEAVSA